jgi:hypothetical protein
MKSELPDKLYVIPKDTLKPGDILVIKGILSRQYCQKIYDDLEKYIGGKFRILLLPPEAEIQIIGEERGDGTK